jgi:hypothetical protein
MALQLTQLMGFGGGVSGVVATHRFLRLDISASQSGSEHAIAKFEPIVSSTGYPTSAMTSNSAPSPLVALANSEDTPQAAYLAFDDTADHWGSDPETASWVQIDLGSGNGITPTSYAITAGDDGKEAHGPKDWTLKGSNTGDFTGEETTLHTTTGEGSWSAGQTRTYTI